MAGSCLSNMAWRRRLKLFAGKKIAPLLGTLAGCNPDRPIDRLIQNAGFEITQLTSDYLKGPKFIAYHYVGAATP